MKKYLELKDIENTKTQLRDKMFSDGYSVNSINNARVVLKNDYSIVSHCFRNDTNRVINCFISNIDSFVKINLYQKNLIRKGLLEFINNSSYKRCYPPPNRQINFFGFDVYSVLQNTLTEEQLQKYLRAYHLEIAISLSASNYLYIYLTKYLKEKKIDADYGEDKSDNIDKFVFEGE